MVTIKDGCGCDPCDCDWKQKLKEAYSRAIQSVNKIGDNDGSVYFPDGTGFVKLPLPRQSDVAQIHTNTEDIANLKIQSVQLQAKDDLLDADISRIDATDTTQNERIQDNADRITSTYNDLVSTEATVATHDSEIITLQAQTQALSKSLVSDVMMTDGTTAGSVQVSVEREDGALITSANYKWGRDIGVRLEAGTQAGYVKAVISLSDGTELVSNEYKIVEVLESDVYVTAITLVPDMAAGTIGGNISYSNGTTQTINSVSVPTAPGVTSAIEALQGRMAAVEQKNANQDASITAIDGRVQALENTPGIGQFTNGKLGTIAGSTTDGRIKAEDDGTGSVNGWNALKQRVSTAEGQIVSAQNDINALDGTVAQQTTDISKLKTDVTNIQNKDTEQDQSIAANASAIAGKVSIAQGVDNAGKALVVGEDGNVQLLESSNIDSIFEPFPISGVPPTSSGSYSVTQWSKISVFKAPLGRSGTTESQIIDVISSIDTATSSITRFRYEMNDDDYVTLANIIKKRYPNLPDRKYKIYVFSASISDYTVEPLPLVLGAQLNLTVSNGVYTVSYLNSKYLYSSKYSSNYVIAIRINSMSA